MTKDGRPMRCSPIDREELRQNLLSIVRIRLLKVLGFFDMLWKMTMLRIAVIAALFVVWHVSNIGQVYACSCVVPGTPSEELANSALVFAGSAVAVREDQPFLGINRLPANGLTTVEFKVDTVWKGNIMETMTLQTARYGASCGFTFVEGEEYIVYSHDGKTVSLCSRTRSLRDAQEDLAALGEGKPAGANFNGVTPETPTSETGSGCGISPGGSLASADGALVVLLAGLMLYRQHKHG